MKKSIASKSDKAPAKAAAPVLLAAIDMGSNSFRLEIGAVNHGRYKRVDYLKETVRLGAGLDAQGLLTEDAAQRGLDCLRRFAERLQGFRAEHVRAVATQTLREARNRDAFLDRAIPVLGHSIEVISGREEARLIYQGVARLQPSELPRLVIDIGGRSTEMIVGQGRVPRRAESFGVGSVSLSLRHFPEGRFTAAGFREAQVAAGAELEEGLVPFARRHWREALGSSGTVGAVSQILQANGITDGTITPDGLRWCIEQCVRAGSNDALELPGLKADRKAVLGGGLSILYTLAAQFGIEALRPAKGALRQGVIFDLEDRLFASSHAGLRDPRETSVRELQRRFQVEVDHAEHVRLRALSLWQDVQGEAPEVEGKDELGWAAALHEVGMLVSHHDFHRHGAYVLAHVDAAGFSQSQLRRMSLLVLGQRGELSKIAEPLHDPMFALQLLCLRLATILHHARTPLPVTVARLQLQNKVAVLAIQPGGPADNPRTLHHLQIEAARWSQTGQLSLQIEPGS